MAIAAKPLMVSGCQIKAFNFQWIYSNLTNMTM